MACRPVVVTAKLDSKMKQTPIVFSTTKVTAEFQYRHLKWRVKATTPDVNYCVLNPLQKKQFLAMLEFPHLPHFLSSPHLLH